MSDGGVRPRVTTPLAGSLPAVPSVSMRVVAALVAAVERAGLERADFLRAAGLDAAQLQAAEARVPRAEVYRICELALDLTGDPAFGLHCVERLTPNTFVPISYLIAHAASLRQGFESLLQFERLLSDERSFELVEQGEEVTLRSLHACEESLRVQRFCAEMAVGGFFHVLRAFGAGARPQRVCFAYAAPSYHDEYARIFEGTQRFEQPFTGIVFERSLLARALPQRDEGVHEALRALAERRMSRLAQRVPYALRVRELLVQREWRDRIDMQAAARTLGLSVRSLRRRLASEGKSYSDVENDAFAIVAKQLLRDKRRTIQEAAYEMGFSDTTTFHRAFKRSTGTTPSRYRDTQSGDEPR